ncbi:tumor necrosis factor ligand superfamily member 8 isoform X2 [Choloepus didactylus]|uniref:tumor necrosis factor ligand superfamily member 8 isoform X2 n=1 Tax=Choloepus didactylus TaxID=27675 RepID=UPI00189FDC18|nr:tumor necrosis factor ligand superfamily member 8 isoform X2 [Choloepus didactylus]
MDPGLPQTLNTVAPTQDTAMHVPPGSVASHLGPPIRSYFCFTTATLALCLIFAVATVMVLVVRRSDYIPNQPDNIPLKGGNCSEDMFCILKRSPFNKTWAYLQVSKHINKTKLSWNEDGKFQGVMYQDGNLVIQSEGFLRKCYQQQLGCSNQKPPFPQYTTSKQPVSALCYFLIISHIFPPLFISTARTAIQAVNVT